MSNPTDLRRAKEISLSLGDYDENGVLSCHLELATAIRASDEAAGLLAMPREPTDEQILAAWYKALPHPEQEMLRLRDADAREMHIEELRTFLYMLTAHGGEDG
jgi:hypothetical protein